MTTINLSGFANPALVADQQLFTLFGDNIPTTFDKVVGFDAFYEAFLGTPIDLDDEDSITISEALELYYRALMPDVAESDRVAGVYSRYKTDGKTITTFRSSYIALVDGVLTFCHGKDGQPGFYSIPLQFDASKATWMIPGTNLLSQAILIEESDGDNKTARAFLSGLYLHREDPEDEDATPIQIKIWINIGLADRDLRKADKGNLKAARAAEKSFHQKKADWSTCVQPLGTGGLKSDLSMFLMPYIIRSNYTFQCVLKVIGLTKTMKEKKEDKSQFPVYEIVIDPNSLPSGLNVQVFDFSKPLPVGGYATQIVDVAAVSFIQVPGNAVSAYYKQAELNAAKSPEELSSLNCPVLMPTEQNPWYLHIKPGQFRSNQKNPSIAIWTRPIDKCSAEIQRLFEASSTLALFGGVSIDDMPERVAIKAAKLDLAPPSSFSDDEDLDIEDDDIEVE